MLLSRWIVSKFFYRGIAIKVKPASNYRLCLSARYFSCLAISSFLFLFGILLVISFSEYMNRSVNRTNEIDTRGSS